jgi:hypothetical protein
MKSSLSSLFLFLLAGQFFSPFFDFMSSSMFWQNTLLTPKEVYHGKEKNSNSIHCLAWHVCESIGLHGTCQLICSSVTQRPHPPFQSLANPQPSLGGVHFPLFFGEAADPAVSPVIAAVPADRGMNLIDELQRKKSVLFFLGLMIELKKVANGKSVSP